LRRIVRQGMEPVSPLGEELEARDRLVERPSEHPLPHRGVARDPARVLGESFRQRTCLRVERRAAVEPRIPLGCAHGREKRVDLGRIAAQVIPEEIPGIPVDEDPAEVEDDVADRLGRHEAVRAPRQAALLSAAIRSSSGGCDRKSRFKPPTWPPEMPNACIGSGRPLSSGPCTRLKPSSAAIMLWRPASLAPPASARNSRWRENHMTIMLARMPNTICATS